MKPYGLTKYMASDDDKAGLRASGRALFHNRSEKRSTRRLIKRNARREGKAIVFILLRGKNDEVDLLT